MKTRNGFVSNSSSTSFIIENKTKENLHLCDFIKENPQLIEQFEREYFKITGKGTKYTQNHSGQIYEIKSLNDIIKIMCEEAKEKEKSEGMDWSPKKTKSLAPGINSVQFGDEEGTILGEIYDYILREGGESKKFRWRFDYYNR